jgi:hypothetical protein
MIKAQNKVVDKVDTNPAIENAKEDNLRLVGQYIIIMMPL